MNNEQIVNSIRSICKEHNITITKLEETLGMSQGLISRWSKSDPSLSKIIDIAEYFNISLDDVVGYKNIINDKFIEKVILETSNQKLIWHQYNHANKEPKEYLNPYFSQIEFLDENDAREYFQSHIELSYFSNLKNGYISIYSYYEDDNIKNPSDIRLFIQPNDNADLIYQDYSKDQLIPLWLKILYTLNEDAPDAIKAEELKHAFISEDDTINLNSTQNKSIDSMLNNQSIIKLVETINTPEFQKLQQIFSNPEFQKTIQAANKIQQNLRIIPQPINQKED